MSLFSKKADEAIINDILLQDHGLIVDNENEEVCSLWFTGIVFNFKLHFRSSQQI